MSYYYYGNDGGGSGRKFLANAPRVTRNLILINIIIFLGQWISEGILHNTIITEKFALFCPGTPFFKVWQPLTYMFLHGGFWHILFNMYTLYIFGCVVERMIGERKFLLFYIICGLGAAATQIGVQLLQHDPIGCTVGASGAIYGVLIAYAMLFPDSKLTLIFPPITLSAKWMVIIFVGIEVISELGMSDGIAHLAHLGGMLFGFLLIRYWKSRGTLFDRKDL